MQNIPTWRSNRDMPPAVPRTISVPRPTCQLRRVIDAFGVKRLMWASDYTVTVDHHTYAESLFCLRCADQLSEGDKEWILENRRELLHWPRPA